VDGIFAMTKTKTDADYHQECTQRFIDLANILKDEGVSTNIVSNGLITAAGLYASYVAAGNDGGLTESGVAKIAEIFRLELERLQKIKKANSGV
jgi:hypothetical protein